MSSEGTPFGTPAGDFVPRPPDDEPLPQAPYYRVNPQDAAPASRYDNLHPLLRKTLDQTRELAVEASRRPLGAAVSVVAVALVLFLLNHIVWLLVLAALGLAATGVILAKSRFAGNGKASSKIRSFRPKR